MPYNLAAEILINKMISTNGKNLLIVNISDNNRDKTLLLFINQSLNI